MKPNNEPHAEAPKEKTGISRGDAESAERKDRNLTLEPNRQQFACLRVSVSPREPNSGWRATMITPTIPSSAGSWDKNR